MTDLWQKRRRAHFLEMLKYLRYVLNDHFVLALLFLVGGLGYGYSNFLKQLGGPTWWAAPVSVIALLILLQLGSLATLVKPADPVFLLPREHDMHQYLNQAVAHSFLFSACLEVVGVAILMPFLSVAGQLTTWQILVLGGTLLVLKLGELYQKESQLYQNQQFVWYKRLIFNWILPLIWFVVALYLNVWVALITAAVQTGGAILAERSVWRTHSLAWRLAIQLEEQRMLRIYRFFNLFTDVPNVRGTVRRRRYLDGLLNLTDRRTDNAYRYLFMRALLRSTEYSGMYFRLTILAAVLLAVVPNLYLSLIMQVLFIYLISFQLLPLLTNYDQNVFTHLYPLKAAQKISGFNWVMTRLLCGTVVFFVSVMGIASGSWYRAILGLVVGMLEVWVLLKFYLPSRMKKLN
ncbi:ABC transporter permease [Pediococcus siamensis]|uniref:ABC transporter permease n=1 Tax=Pediococcus siamensis TaxID=381829 RepID=UPI0039A29824